MNRYLLAAAAGTALAAAAALWPTHTPATPSAPIPYTTVEQGMAAAWQCGTPVSYAINPAGAPPDAAQVWADAFGELAAATGLQFQSAGTTASVAETAPAPEDGRDADIIISYLSPDAANTSPMLAASPDAVGSTVTYTSFNPPLGLLRDAGHLIGAANISIVTDPTVPEPQVAIHEAVHAIGLDHADEGSFSIMTPHLNTFGPHLSPTDTQALAVLYHTCMPASQ